MANIPGTTTPNGHYIGGNTVSNYPYNGNTWTITIGPNTNPITTTTGGISVPYEDTVKTTEGKKDTDGHKCKSCDEFYPMAESNQPDGTLICYACRHNL